MKPINKTKMAADNSTTILHSPNQHPIHPQDERMRTTLNL
jgi:hypothetical protein